MAFSYGNRLLLDMHDGARFAYSLRKLNRDYNGPIVKVRRDSDDAELDIGFYRYTLDTQAISNFVGSGNGYVKTWYDQSNNGYHLQQTTSSNQPYIYSSGSLVVEGTQPAIYFDTACNMSVSNLPSLSQPFSVYRVYRGKDLTRGEFVAFSTLTLNSVSTGANRMSAGVILNLAISVFNYQITYNEFNSTTSKIFSNPRLSEGNAGTNSMPNSGSIQVGGIRSFTMQELIVYPTDKPNFRDMSRDINNFYQVY
jgi:hypothetical protein